MKSAPSEDHKTNTRIWPRNPGACPEWDGALLLALVVGLNLHLAGIGSAAPKIFLPTAFAEGQWWRLLTYPFVHVSWYHLLLDAGAFFLLYAQMNEHNALQRIFCLICCTGASLIVALLASPVIESIGLGGLSGTAHGLMACSGLTMMRKPSQMRTGGLIFGLVALKSLREAVSGQVIFGFMHLGACGIPLAACHLGGVMGGVLAWWLIKNEPLAVTFVSIRADGFFCVRPDATLSFYRPSLRGWSTARRYFSETRIFRL